MSIGSETNGGVSNIRVSDLSLDGTDNGIRIKSNGRAAASRTTSIYDDVCMRNSPNPITLDTGYTAAGTVQGNSPPTMRDITLHNVRVSGGGKFSFNGYDHDSPRRRDPRQRPRPLTTAPTPTHSTTPTSPSAPARPT